MFSSIRWKFIVVYFLLVFIAMVIIGIFIVNRMENQQLETARSSMEQQIETIMSTSSYIATGNWTENREGIQNTLNDWRLGTGETLYVIYDEEVPKILATTNKQYESIIGNNALSYRYTDPTIIGQAFYGERAQSVIMDDVAGNEFMHYSAPVFSSVGKINGILYMTSDLSNVQRTIEDSRAILTNATLIALGITIVLGFFIASSITGPIRDVTKKAEEMALGDFDQFVEVKSDDEIGQLAGMFNHLTLKLKDTIEEMDLERSKLDTIFSYMAEGVIAVDKNGSIIHANPIGQNLMEIDDSHLDSSESFALDKLGMENIDYTDPETLSGETTFQKDEGVYKVKYAPYKNERDHIAGLIMVLQDITQEHRLDNMRKEFVANVSHELKTPITTIKSYAETLMTNEVDQDTQQRFLSVIDRECDRMGRLVRDLLQLSNIDYQKTKWNRENISIGDMLLDSIGKLQLLAHEKNQRIETYIQPDLPQIKADRDGMEQVMLNILSNAIKYTETNGTIKAMAKNRDSFIDISISDNGIGIPEEDVGRIFERFYRVEKGRSRDMGGTGLGLSIAKEIIEAHDGTIEITSKKNQGTVVRITLPVM
ncbi:MAG: cell wall metabolism sensor histidine kinase WalK [Gudongella sp.]|nr:cell wall metabolism sensor histidine kinase WalK [Gudongella sp.]